MDGVNRYSVAVAACGYLLFFSLLLWQLRREWKRRSITSDKRIILGDLPSRADLLAAGWCEDQRLLDIKPPEADSLFPAAKRILDEFAGLRFRTPQSDVEIAPISDKSTMKDLRFYERQLGMPLYLIGNITYGDTMDLYVNPAGHLFILIAHDSMQPLASSFEKSLKYLMNCLQVDEERQREDLTPIGLYGKKWDWDEAEAESIS